MRIAIVGKMRSGKDTIADMLTVQYDFEQIAFADGIKEIVGKYFPEVLDNGKPREHYQFIGQQFRKLNQNVWINNLDRKTKEMGDSSIIVTDCRQVNEGKYLRANDYMIIKVIAEDEVRLQRISDAGESVTTEQFEHDTETQVDEIRADFAILNNGTYEDLQIAVDSAYQYYTNYFMPDRERAEQEVQINESK